GPNGAGKTTTLKLLSGLLYPTSGLVQVLGHAPWRRDYRFLRQIALLRGSRPLSAPPELTVLDALRFQQVLYDVHDVAFRGNLADLSAMLGLEPLLQRQVRALSLGERMRCGLACALLYRPRVLFLDEPSVGLDVSAVAEVRRFIRDYSAETKATVVLTSHYMADVEALCRRVILIDRGAVAYDGALAQLAERLAPYRLMTVRLSGPAQADWSRFGEVVSMDAGCVRLRLPREEVAAITAYVLSEAPVADLAIEEPPLETVIDRAYRQGMEA
ncbi:MAG TPA: ATP-binding cassette domain-containing protein, partial [Dehalococcoidia bacterium]|nr:ATP-binding cassette domain-containing protein [Dehalococcoidia bacterium]